MLPNGNIDGFSFMAITLASSSFCHVPYLLSVGIYPLTLSSISCLWTFEHSVSQRFVVLEIFRHIMWM